MRKENEKTGKYIDFWNKLRRLMMHVILVGGQEGSLNHAQTTFAETLRHMAGFGRVVGPLLRETADVVDKMEPRVFHEFFLDILANPTKTTRHGNAILSQYDIMAKCERLRMHHGTPPPPDVLQVCSNIEAACRATTGLRNAKMQAVLGVGLAAGLSEIALRPFWTAGLLRAGPSTWFTPSGFSRFLTNLQHNRIPTVARLSLFLTALGVGAYASAKSIQKIADELPATEGDTTIHTSRARKAYHDLPKAHGSKKEIGNGLLALGGAAEL